MTKSPVKPIHPISNSNFCWNQVGINIMKGNPLPLQRPGNQVISTMFQAAWEKLLGDLEVV